MNREYFRDGRSPIPDKETTSRTMSSITAKNTSPEIELRIALRKLGLTGYRLHWKKVAGSPDIAFPGKKVAIFVNGCFWHRCPFCNPPFPKTHQEFWTEKFNRNIERDKRKNVELIMLGWKVLTFWECQINNDSDKCAESVKDIIV